jgi:hypothetical protein
MGVLLDIWTKIAGGSWVNSSFQRRAPGYKLRIAMILAKIRAVYAWIAAVIGFCYPIFCQTMTPGFQFPAGVKPGDSLTITGADLGGITSVTLKAPGKADLPAGYVQATPTSITFTVPPAASGSYTVVLSPGSIAPIPLTVSTPATVQVARVYMPDGQIKSHSIRVYITRDIQSSQSPKLRLLRSHAVTSKGANEASYLDPVEVAPGQEWIESVDGQKVRRSGTLLLFDLSQMDLDFKAMLRVMPVVTWNDAGIVHTAIGEREVNLGNIVPAIIWTAAIVGVVILAILLLSWKGGDNPLLLLAGVDGHLSLSQTQIACWTVVVGGVVLSYGLIKLDIPNIPASLLVLMGASLATGGIGFFQDARKQQAAVAAGVIPLPRNLSIGDLIRVFPVGQPPELSLAKAQMVFWTALLLALFVSKSILDGAIWEVPWALVALMGFSQAGYLAPKLTAQI